MLKVCEKIKISISTLQSHLKKRDLSRSNKYNSRKYSLKESFFSKINSESKAYWLGFLYADGYVSQGKNIGITIANSDRKHLEKFNKSISPVSVK